MKRILIMMTDAGGGHRASAQALRDVFQERYGDVFHVNIVDMWMKHTPPPLSRLPKTYHRIVKDTPRLYKFVFSKTFEEPKLTSALLDAAYGYAKRPLMRAFRQYDPDLIISVHPLMQDIPLRILQRMQYDVPFVTVVTDLVKVHPTWLHRDVTLCFVPTEEVYQQALQAGLRAEQVRRYGLPVRPAFAREIRPKHVLRKELGMAPDLPAVLLVGGGEGMGPVADIAQAVAGRLGGTTPVQGRPGGQLVVICGRNEKLRAKLRAYDWPTPTIISGFVENMQEWMAACDCIVTKAGPGTIAESLITGLPIVLSGYVAGQEDGNVPYVLGKGVGAYSEDPQKIAETICRWFGPEQSRLAEMSMRASQLGRPQATYQIVTDIALLLGAAP